MSKANGAYGEENNGNEQGDVMSFRKVTPVKKNRKPAAPVAKKHAPKKAAPKRRPVGHKG